VGAGLAIASKREQLDNKVYVLCGDGELAEGQVWEAANFAAYHKLDNLIAILDINRLAQSVLKQCLVIMWKEYAQRFSAFGFEVINIDGHNYDEIDNAFKKATKNENGKPVAIVAKTLKGKGISFLENKTAGTEKL
jgi:transketolase